MFLWFMNGGWYVLCCTAAPKAEGVIQKVSKHKLQDYVLMVYEWGLVCALLHCNTKGRKCDTESQQA